MSHRKWTTFFVLFSRNMLIAQLVCIVTSTIQNVVDWMLISVCHCLELEANIHVSHSTEQRRFCMGRPESSRSSTGQRR